jgi:hypothetical protein
MGGGFCHVDPENTKVLLRELLIRSLKQNTNRPKTLSFNGITSHLTFWYQSFTFNSNKSPT